MTRILSFDLARGFTVLIMPAIHTVMLCSTPAVQQSFLGAVLTFIAEGPGAQLFMLIMGAVYVLKLPHSANANSRLNGADGVVQTKGAAAAFKRSLYLLLAAYLLNFFKFLIPLAFDVMPENLLTELQMTNDTSAAIFFFSIGDILHFAAIANLVLFAITRTRYYSIIAIALAIAIIFLSPMLWDVKTGIGWLDYIIGLFNGRPPQTFFPVLPWIVYPLIGLALGNALKYFDTSVVFKRSATIGAILVIISLGLPATPLVTDYLSFYRTYPADTIFHIGVVLLWLQLWQWLSTPGRVFRQGCAATGRNIRKGKITKRSFGAGRAAIRLLIFSSKNITVIYLIQWILICWMMCFTGYMRLPLWVSIIWMTNATLATLLFTWLLTRSSPNTRNS